LHVNKGGTEFGEPQPSTYKRKREEKDRCNNIFKGKEVTENLLRDKRSRKALTSSPQLPSQRVGEKCFI